LTLQETLAYARIRSGCACTLPRTEQKITCRVSDAPIVRLLHTYLIRYFLASTRKIHFWRDTITCGIHCHATAVHISHTHSSSRTSAATGQCCLLRSGKVMLSPFV
ncbi:unnamed protein product, partial [Ectocarpus sp. 12 AP-2014]